MKSWRTTATGALGFLAVFCQQLHNHFDASASTVAEWGLIVGAFFAFLAAYNARDKGVSSEEEGAK